MSYYQEGLKRIAELEAELERLRDAGQRLADSMRKEHACTALAPGLGCERCEAIAKWAALSPPTDSDAP